MLGWAGSRVGLTGYCMGGRMAVRTAAQYPARVAAAASFHGGRLVTEDPNSPHRLVDQDQGMPAAHIAQLEAALQAARIRYRSERYSGARHGFTMSDLPVYDQAACQQHWDRLLDLFERTLR